MIAATNLLNLPLLAQTTGPSLSVCWAIVIFCVLLGLLVGLRPIKRSVEVKRRGE